MPELSNHNWILMLQSGASGPIMLRSGPLFDMLVLHTQAAHPAYIRDRRPGSLASCRSCSTCPSTGRGSLSPEQALNCFTLRDPTGPVKMSKKDSCKRRQPPEAHLIEIDFANSRESLAMHCKQQDLHQPKLLRCKPRGIYLLLDHQACGVRAARLALHLH